MKRFAVVLVVIMLFGCFNGGSHPTTGKEMTQAHSAAAVTLSDFSMKIVAYYEAQKMPVPGDFNANQFFTVLEKQYPDQTRVKQIRETYKTEVRPLDGGYSIILCDRATDAKIMEDFSCHLNRVEIQLWEKDPTTPCVFETDWKPYCLP